MNKYRLLSQNDGFARSLARFQTIRLVAIALTGVACFYCVTLPENGFAQTCSQPPLTFTFPDNSQLNLAWNGTNWTYSGTGWCGSDNFTLNARVGTNGYLEGEVVITGGPYACNGQGWSSTGTRASGGTVVQNFSSCCVANWSPVITYSGSLCSSCTFNGQDVSNGSTVTAYQSGSVWQGDQCVSERRTCTTGSLSGSYTFAQCTLVTPELSPLTAALLATLCLFVGWHIRRHAGHIA